MKEMATGSSFRSQSQVRYPCRSFPHPSDKRLVHISSDIQKRLHKTLYRQQLMIAFFLSVKSIVLYAHIQGRVNWTQL